MNRTYKTTLQQKLEASELDSMNSVGDDGDDALF